MTYFSVADPDLQLRKGPAFKGLTMNLEFCEDNSGTSKKMHNFQENKVGAWAPPLDPPLLFIKLSECGSSFFNPPKDIIFMPDRS